MTRLNESLEVLPPLTGGAAFAPPRAVPRETARNRATLTWNGPSEPLRAATRLSEALRDIDRGARRERRTLPSDEERALAASRFHQALDAMSNAQRDDGLEQDGDAVRDVLNGWFLRSRYWNRSFVKPHGYAGDFRMLEWMYDLEGNACADPTQPAIVNVLDGLYAEVESVQAV